MSAYAVKGVRDLVDLRADADVLPRRLGPPLLLALEDLPPPPVPADVPRRDGDCGDPDRWRAAGLLVEHGPFVREYVGRRLEGGLGNVEWGPCERT